MNNLLIGVLIGVGLFIMLLFCLYIGYRIGSRIKKATELEPLTDEEKLRDKKLHDDIVKIMNYNVDIAYKRGDMK